MCLDTEATFDALEIEHPVEQSCCKVKNGAELVLCPVFHACGYHMEVVSRVVYLDGSAAARPRGLKRWRAGGGAVAIAGSSAGSGWRRQPEPEIHDDRRDDDPARPGREGPRC
jgi:hypothetical protein